MSSSDDEDGQQRRSRAPGPGGPSRAHPRHRAAEPVQIHCETWGRFVELHTKDISYGGVFVETGEPPPIHSDVRITIALPEAHALAIRGRVVHIVSVERAAKEAVRPGMGLQFDMLTDEQKRQIDSLVALARRRAATEDTGDEPTGASAETKTPESDRAIPSQRTSRRRRPRRRRGSRDAPPSVEEVAVLARLLDDLQSLREADDFAVLGLNAVVNKHIAHSTFLELCKKRHPDLYGRFSDPRIRDVANEIFMLTQAAFRRIWDGTTAGRKGR